MGKWFIGNERSLWPLNYQWRSNFSTLALEAFWEEYVITVCALGRGRKECSGVGVLCVKQHQWSSPTRCLPGGVSTLHPYLTTKNFSNVAKCPWEQKNPIENHCFGKMDNLYNILSEESLSKRMRREEESSSQGEWERMPSQAPQNKWGLVFSVWETFITMSSMRECGRS